MKKRTEMIAPYQVEVWGGNSGNLATEKYAALSIVISYRTIVVSVLDNYLYGLRFDPNHQ
jgi:hypothetical protein